MPTIHDIGYNAAGVAYTYTTPQTLYDSAAFVSGDTIRLNYSTQYKCPHWFGRLLINNAAKLAVTIVGATTLGVPISWAYDSSQIVPSINSTVLVVEDIIFTQGQLSLAPATSLDATLRRCGFLNASFGVSAGNSTATHTVLLENCWGWGVGTLAFVATGGSGATMTCKQCTITRHRYGFYRGNASTSGPLTATNCIAEHSGASTPFYNLTTAGSTNNAGRIVKACGANPVDLATTPPVWLDEILFGVPQWLAAMRNSSGLLTAGANSGLSSDMLGKAYSGGNFPIGASAGTEFVDLAKLLENATPAGSIPLANVLVASGGTFDEAARNVGVAADKILTGNSIKIQNVTTAGTFDEAARNTDPGVANVKAPTAYKIQNVSLVGTYSAGLTPDAPAVSAVSVGDGTVTVHVTLNSSDDPAYLVWTAFGRSANWTTPSESYKVTADGDITVSGLTNYREYAFAAISKSGGVYSQHSDAMVIEVPRPTTSDVSVRMRDQIAGATTQMLQRSGCGTVVYFREYPGADLVTLWASIDEGGSVQQLMRRGETDVETMSMTIPRQTDFPPSAGFKPGCEIHVGSVVYEVDTVQPDRATVDLASSFKISVFRHVHF